MPLSRRCALSVLVLAAAHAACSPSDVGSPGGPDARRGGDGGDGDRTDARVVDEGELVWRDANLTNFTSYPEPGSEECEDFNGCAWAGRFAFVEGQQTEAWVMAHNIAAVRADHADTYALRTLRLREGAHRIDVTVYDMCSDADCGGCCTRNSQETGFLIDLEWHTAQRFGLEDGVVEWACLDCE